MSALVNVLSGDLLLLLLLSDCLRRRFGGFHPFRGPKSKHAPRCFFVSPSMPYVFSNPTYLESCSVSKLMSPEVTSGSRESRELALDSHEYGLLGTGMSGEVGAEEKFEGEGGDHKEPMNLPREAKDDLDRRGLLLLLLLSWVKVVWGSSSNGAGLLP